jgi:restriction system protein
VSWTNPDEWIAERLAGTHQETALRIWRGTHGRVNPRHLTGLWLISNTYELLAEDGNRVLQLTPKGRDVIE